MDPRPLVRLILWCWVLYAQCFVSAAGTGTEQALLSHAAGNPNSSPKLLYVWEYDCIFDWEPVQVRDDLTASAISWLLSLHDRLTVSRHKPLGEGLMVSLPASDALCLQAGTLLFVRLHSQICVCKHCIEPYHSLIASILS